MTSRNFIQALEEVTIKYPAAPAIIDRGRAYTYRSIWDEAACIANFLASRGIGREDIVGINLIKSKDYIVSLLGTWMAGAAFLPLDPGLPKARRDYIVAEAQPKYIISDTANIIGEPLRPAPLLPDDLAYVIYTSGSTGNSKGVMVTHRGLMPMLNTQIPAFGFAPGKKSLFYLSISFDASISDIGTSLLSGSTLVIEDEAKLKDGASLVRVLHEHQITHFDCPPSLLRALEPAQMPSSLETLVIGGEICPPETVRKWAERFRVINVYGPTEATVCSSLCRCDAKTWTRPLIGQPLPGTRFHVLGGELYIEGEGLARGYLKQPALTAEKFVIINGKRLYRTGDGVRELPHGEIVFLGRIDRQFKLRGQLIEPAEIESRLLQCTGVTRAAVLKRPLTEGMRKEMLVAFISPADVSIDRINASLRATLPQWMVPYHIERVSGLPLTASGKPDYAQLEKAPLALNYHKSEAQMTAMEKKLSEIWQKILGHDLFGLDDNFFHVGGDSLDVIRLTLEAERAALRFSPGWLAENPTLHQLAKAVEGHAEGDWMSADDLRREAVLDIDLSQEIPLASSPAKNIFLTGVTGALGSRLLLELLDKTEARIYCLTRAKNEAEAKRRLKDKIGFEDDRLIAVAGDIAEKHLGLSDETWASLCLDIDAIYHCAAIVNMVASYTDLKSANVGGVKEILCLALTEKKKPVHYASTLSVFVATDRNTGTAYESDRLDKTQKIHGGYAQTKWAAEHLLSQAEATLPVSQYRLGLITGDSLTGTGAETDFLSLFVRGITSLGLIPPRDRLRDLAIDITPIDYAAAAMTELSLHKKPDVYHLANRRSLTLPELLSSLERCGIKLSEATQQNWEHLPQTRALTSEESSAWLALCRVLPEKDFERLRAMDLFQSTGITFDMAQSGFTCPPPEPALIDLYVRYILSRQSKTRRICLFGPESTGKSTLAEKLAEYFGAAYVPEFAKELIHRKSGKITATDIPAIAGRQLSSEDAAAITADKLLICDTDALTTKIWSEWLFGDCPLWIKTEAVRRKYDLYLLMDIDVPWINDIHRYTPERQEFMKICERELQMKNARYVKISGNWQERFDKAIAAIKELA